MNAPVAKTCRQRCPFARFASICALVACALLLLPAVARADGYSMTQTYISATVEADGSLAVVEGRQFDFDDDINGVFWEINTGSNQQGGTAGVDVLSVEEEDTAFNKVDSANKGDSGVYTVEQTGDGVRIKVFSPHESGDSAIYYVSYTMTGAVMNWADTAELYWKFVGDGWSADSDDVEMEVCFANAAAGTAAVKGDNFRAWGHGPLTGDVSLDEDEPMVTYTIPCVHQGEFAEARIAFPSDWVPQLAASGEERMSTILSEEKEWADEANARREHARAVASAIAVVCVVVAVAYTGVIVMLKLRRPKPKPLFQDEYFRDVPSADHPAVLATLMSWNDVPDQAYIATLMKLTDDRVIKLEEATETKKKGLLRREKEEQTYRITVTDEAWKAAKKDGIDRDVLKVFFAGVKPDKDGVRSRTFSELEEYVGVRGVLLIAKYNVDRHGLDIENLERLADLLIHMRTQSIGYRRLASRNLDIHTWLQSASGTYCTGYVPIAVHLITRIPKDPNNDCLIPHTEVSHFSVAKCAIGGRRRLWFCT